MTIAIDKSTVSKFNVPGPRYTSYPTAPAWSAQVSQSDYRDKLRQFGDTGKTLSLYVHIPFCQTMCTYCACSVVIRRKDEKYGDEYVAHLIKEIDLVRQAIGKKKVIKQLHFGGGTPTFLNELQLERLYRHIAEAFFIDQDAEIAMEIDPRTIDKAKIGFIKQLGFNRISLGVQDFDEEVQKHINRFQPLAQVQEIYKHCRSLNFSSINFDLIYGLPHQTAASFRETVKEVIALRPDRIALYSFAYVPWLKKHQEKIDPASLPNENDKLELFLNSREQLIAGGYESIAMDHFALKADELAKAFHEGKLYRNFMGYTVRPADEYIGLGMTAIGFLENTFFQNNKTLPDYYQTLDEGRLPIERGKILSKDDRIRQWTINSLMCHFRVDKLKFSEIFGVDFDAYFAEEKGRIDQCTRDGLLDNTPRFVTVSELGKIFIRNVCMSFDQYLKQDQREQRFSKTV